MLNGKIIVVIPFVITYGIMEQMFQVIGKIINIEILKNILGIIMEQMHLGMHIMVVFHTIIIIIILI